MKQILFTTVCNDEYAPGGHVMLYSMKKHIKGFEELCDVKIYWNKKIAPLSKKSREKFQKISSNIMFECVDEQKYYKGKLRSNRAEGCKAAYLALESFKEYDYNRVIMFDTDMLWIANTCPLCEFSDEQFQSDLTLRGQNTGFVVINKKCRTPEVYNELIDKIADHDGSAMDQGIINKYFSANLDIRSVSRDLPQKYNEYPFVNIDTDRSVKDQCTILHWAHYDHIKPWAVGKYNIPLFLDAAKEVKEYKEYIRKNPGAASIRYPSGDDTVGNIPILQDRFAYLIWDTYKQEMKNELSK